ncbi:MAG: hypothetical protein ACK4GU_04405 [Alishewanella aestuarii]
MNVIEQQESTTIISVMTYVNYHVLVTLIFAAVTVWLCIKIHKNSNQKLLLSLSKKLHTGYGNIIFVMAGILWASSVSVFGSDIKKQIFETDEISWETLTFFVTVMMTLIIGVLHYAGQQHKDRLSQSRPPLKAIQATSKHVIELKKILSECLFDWVTIDSKVNNNTLQKDELSSLLRTLSSAQKFCLQSLLYVAHSWDENNEKVTYNSNLFKIADSHKLLEAFEKGNLDVGPMHSSTFSIQAIEASPFFLFSDNWQAKLQRTDFLLVGEQSLSVSLSSHQGKEPECKELPKQSTPPICMPFSEATEYSTVKQPNLHGAPTARKMKRPVYISDVQLQITNTLEDLKNSPIYKAHFSNRFEEDLRRYYEADNTKSILSIPIHMYDIEHILSREQLSNSSDTERPVVCITNVYSNKVNMFVHDDMASSYCDLVKPICYVMSLLVSLTLKCVQLQEELLKRQGESQNSDYTNKHEHQSETEEAKHG